jgi:hypothetical protein
MAPGLEVIERIEDDVEALEPGHVELGVLDVVVVRLDDDVGVELARGFLCDQGLGLLDVLAAEQKLPVQVAQVNRVEVDNVDFAKPGQDQILEQLAADAAGSDHEHARLVW